MCRIANWFVEKTAKPKSPREDAKYAKAREEKQKKAEIGVALWAGGVLEF